MSCFLGQRSQPKQVMFSDGIRPGGDLMETESSSDSANPPPPLPSLKKPTRSAKKVEKTSTGWDLFCSDTIQWFNRFLGQICWGHIFSTRLLNNQKCFFNVYMSLILKRFCGLHSDLCNTALVTHFIKCLETAFLSPPVHLSPVGWYSWLSVCHAVCLDRTIIHISEIIRVRNLNFTTIYYVYRAMRKKYKLHSKESQHINFCQNWSFTGTNLGVFYSLYSGTEPI